MPIAPSNRWYFQLLTAGNHFQRGAWSAATVFRGLARGSNAAIAIVPRRSLIAQQRRAPGHAAAQRLEQQQIAALDAPIAHPDIECQWHRGGRGIAVLLHGHD